MTWPRCNVWSSEVPEKFGSFGSCSSRVPLLSQSESPKLLQRPRIKASTASLAWQICANLRERNRHWASPVSLACALSEKNVQHCATLCNICNDQNELQDNRPVVSAMLPKQPYSRQNSQESCSSPGRVAVHGIVNSIIPNHSNIVLQDSWRFALPPPLSRRPVAELRPRLALCREFPPCLKWWAVGSPLKDSHVQARTGPLSIVAPKFISSIHASKSIRRISAFEHRMCPDTSKGCQALIQHSCALPRSATSHTCHTSTLLQHSTWSCAWRVRASSDGRSCGAALKVNKNGWKIEKKNEGPKKNKKSKNNNTYCTDMCW